MSKNDVYPWQEETWRKLSAAVPAHALLLHGRKGLGKLAFARALARARLCENPSIAGSACGKCASCRWFEQGSHPDFRLIEPEALAAAPGSADATGEEGGRGWGRVSSEDVESGTDAVGEPGESKSRKKPSRQIGVAQIRSLGDFINISSHQNGYRIILIHPAETMNPAAANALLKNLEEPPARTLFVLVAHQAQHLLPTIRSRCRQIVMPAPTPEVAADWLRHQGVRNPEWSLASAGYAPLAALEYGDPRNLERHRAFIGQIGTPGTFDPVALAEELQKSDLASVINWLQKWCHDLMSFRMTGTIRYHPDWAETLESVAPELDPRSLAAYIRTLAETARLASHPLNPRLFLEELLFSYLAALSPAPSDPRVPG